MVEAPDITPQGNEPIIPAWVLTTSCILIFGVTSAYFFRGVWNPLKTIEGTDASLWLPMFVQKWTTGLYIPRWFPHFLAGIGQQFHFLSHGFPFIMTLPPSRFHGFQFMVDSFLCGAFMFAFMRSRGASRFGALVGGLAYQLGNNLLTNAAQGGLWKFDTVCWVPLFLLFFFRVIEHAPGRAKNCIFAGATLGLQFLGGEIQLTYYVCLLALAYFIFDSAGRLWTNRKALPWGESIQMECKSALWAALCAALGVVFAAEVVCTYSVFARSNENVGVRGDEDNWRFVTEWSFPPEETLSLALSGRVFASSSYSRSYTEQPIERISDDYIGVVVLMFAFLALFTGRRQAYFWGGMAVVALIISFGRYFPLLFRIIYELPLMKGLRTPHKWLFLTALCVPVLAGIGADFWNGASPSRKRRMVLAILLFAGLVALLALVSPAVTGVPPRVTLKHVSVPLAVLALASVGGLLGTAKRVVQSSGIRFGLSVFLIALLSADLIINASRFITYYDYEDRYVEDDLAQWLRSQPKPFRVKLWSENAYLRYLTTEVLPYHGIDMADAILSRRPRRYSEFFQALRERRIPFERYFQLFNVKYILSPVPLPKTQYPVDFMASFTSSGAFRPGEESFVYEFVEYLPRVFVVDRFEVAESETILDVIGRPDFDLRTTVALEKHPGLILDEKTGGPVWSVKNFVQSPHKVSMNITIDRPSILVLHDFMDEYWHAYVDTEEVELMQANYLMRAVVVPEGAHIVIFTYEPPVWGYTITLAAWVVIISIVIYIGAQKALSFYRANHGPT